MDAEMNIQSGLSNENMSTWAEVDGAATQLKINIPEELMNILIINGFSSLRLIAEMTDQDISNIETFSRENLKDIISNDRLKSYLGIFAQCPEKFIIVGGHRKILELLKDFFTKKQKQNTSDISYNQCQNCSTTKKT